jgi:hypothetical protein
MEMVMTEKAAVLVLATFAFFLLALIWYLFRRLKRESPEVYESIGSPDLFTNNNIAQIGPVWRWIFIGSSRSNLSRGTLAIVLMLRLLAPVYFIIVVLLIGRSLLG